MAATRFIPTGKRVYALAWDGHDLVDFADGPDRWPLNGTVASQPPVRRNFGFPFDQAVASPSGRFQAVYAERGTKALLLRDGKIVRELNRSYYHAEDFDYPITLDRLPDGREIVIHCPHHYNVLHVEDAETGQLLTGGTRTPVDVFHSRLSVSPDGRHLLMAGRVWSPYGLVLVFDLPQAAVDPSTLDGWGDLPLRPGSDAEIASACWLDADTVVIGAMNEATFDDEGSPELAPGQLGVWSISGGRWLYRNTPDHPIGTLVACGRLVMSMFGHPRLLDPATGQVVAEWSDVDAGRKDAAYGVRHVATPVTALHLDGSHLAIAQSDSIAVLTLPT